MIITYYGLQFFKIQQGELTIGYNPISKKSAFGGRQVRFGADIALVAMNHPDFNGVENLSHGEKEAFVISGPGEYERKGISVRGYLTKSHYGGKEERIHTLYKVTIDEMTLGFVGALDHNSLSEEIQEEMAGVHILFVPIGEKDVLSPGDAYKVALSIEPAIIIPMHYGPSGEGVLKRFLKEAGAEGVKSQEELTIKKKDIEGKEGEVMVLEALE